MGVADEELTWVGITVAARERGCVQPAFQRAAIVGEVRTKLIPGRTPLFCLEDARRIVLPRKGPPRTG